MDPEPASLAVALATWMSQRLLDTVASPLDATRTYALTIVDPAGLDPSAMVVRAALLDDGAHRTALRAEDRPDAIAAASRLWLVPPGDLDQPLRPRAFAARRPALGVAVVCEDGVGAVIRFEHAPEEVQVTDARRAAGLLVPAVLRWRASDERGGGRGAA